jgi:tripartite-type tricarboxylate transporter receptor subunit TctC
VIRALLLCAIALPAWAQNQYVLVVPASSKISGVTELIAEATARPGELSYPAGDAAGELFARMTKTKLTQVPGAVLDDLLRDKVSFMFATVESAASHVNSGKLRAFAVTGGRAEALPKVPTMAEAGFRGFDEELARSKAR